MEGMVLLVHLFSKELKLAIIRLAIANMDSEGSYSLSS